MKINLLKEMENYLSNEIQVGAIDTVKYGWIKSVSVILIFIICGAFLLSSERSLVSNIAKLEQFTTKVSLGDLEQKIKIDSKDEIGNFADIFSQMVKDVKEARNEILQEKHEIERSHSIIENQNRELKQFSYIVAHDLQEPLQTITQYLSLLKEDNLDQLDKNSRELMQYTTETAMRMSVLIKDLLEYCQIGEDKKLTKVDCHAIVNDIIHDISWSISATNSTIDYVALPQINGYETELRLLFQNLIVNAIKYTNNDTPPRIKISAQNQDGYWTFAISDNGIGISQEYQKSIFVVFERLHGRSEYMGTGIGLAHCKKIVEIHGGKIWVESTLDIGSTFYFSIPV